MNRQRLLAAAEAMDKAAFTRADLVELIGAQLPVDTERSPRELVEAAVDALGVRVTTARLAHQREGHERFTLEAFVAEEQAVLDLVDAADARAQLWVREHDTDGLSADQARAVTAIANTAQLVCPLSAPAGAGKTTSMRALAAMARRRFHARVIVVAPTGKAVDVAVREGAGTVGYTVAKALKSLQDGSLTLGHLDLVIVDEAAMVGTEELRRLLTATTAAHTKTVLVGDAHQLAPVKARGGCSPNSVLICPGRRDCPRCGGCATPPNVPPRWPCATAGRRRCAAPSTGIGRMAGCTPGTRSPWPPTLWPPIKPMWPPVRMLC